MHMLKFCLLLCSLVLILVKIHAFSVLFLKIFVNVKSRDGNRAAVAELFHCADIL
jgi:hypothetical protein